jgi:glycerol uptake facilitator-like aquaporin
MLNISISDQCVGLKSYPFGVFGGSIIFFALFVPLLLFYTHWDSTHPRGIGDLVCGGYLIYIPSISKTWRNRAAIIPVFTGAVICLEVYIVCLQDNDVLVCLFVGLGLAMAVFIFNDETGPIASTHLILAFAFFAYLLWIVYICKDYFFDDYIWYWPYFPMGLSFLFIGSYSYADSKKDDDYKDAHWPWYIAVLEYIFIITSIINIILIPGQS